MQLARDLIELSGGRQAAASMIKSIYGGIDQLVTPSMPPQRVELYRLIQRDIQVELIKAVPDLLDISASVFASNLTEQELRDYLAWMKSSSGQAVARKTPAIVQTVVNAQLPYMRALMPKLLQKAADDVCADAKCSEEDKKVVLAALNSAVNKTGS
jgi:hypothetical protein